MSERLGFPLNIGVTSGLTNQNQAASKQVPADRDPVVMPNDDSDEDQDEPVVGVLHSPQQTGEWDLQQPRALIPRSTTAASQMWPDIPPLPAYRPLVPQQPKMVMGGCNTGHNILSGPYLPTPGPALTTSVSQSLAIGQNTQQSSSVHPTLEKMKAVTASYRNRYPSDAPPLVGPIPNPRSWDDLVPNWMPAKRTKYPGRETFHKLLLSVSVSAKKGDVTKTGKARLELFRAAYPSLHFVLRQMPGEFLRVVLHKKTYETFIKWLKDGLDKDHLDMSVPVPMHQKSKNMPVIQYEWDHWIEDWDTAGFESDVKELITTNWDDVRREAWKVMHCPILYNDTLFQQADVRDYVSLDGSLVDGLPKVVLLGVNSENRMFIAGMSMK